MRSREPVDMIHGKLGKKIILYAIPLALTGILQQLFNAADTAVLGRFVGTDAMAAVGSDAPLVILVINFLVGISLGANVVIANAIGAQDKEKVSRAVHTAILFSVLAGAAAAVVCEAGVGAAIRLLNVPPSVAPMALAYMRIYLAALPVIMLYNFEAAVLRADGDTGNPLIALVVSGVINVGLNIFFVAALGMSVDGVAWATMISNALAALYLFLCLVRRNSLVRLVPSRLAIDRKTLGEILQIGVPSGVQTMVYGVANLYVQACLNTLGAECIAGYVIGHDAENSAYFLQNAFAGACTTFVGQNAGAGKRDRCRQVLKTTLLWDLVFTDSCCLLIFLLARPLVGIFTTDPAVAEAALLRLYVSLVTDAVFTIGDELPAAYMRGYGYSAVPALFSIIGVCGTRVLWTYTVFRARPTYSVLILANPMSMVVTSILMIALLVHFEKRSKA